MKRSLICFLVVALLVGGFVFASESVWRETTVAKQDPYRRRGGGRYRRRIRDPHNPSDRNGVPVWKNDQQFNKDVFTFCRIMYRNYGGFGLDTDYPDADLNFSYRLQQLTSLKVDPNGVKHWLTDPELFDYPFIYFSEPGGGSRGYSGMELSEDEIVALRKYLLRGGFAMFDDFWGEGEWQQFERVMKRVFPKRKIVDLPQDHEIFHIVYDIDEMPMIPDVHNFQRGYLASRPGVTEAHYRGIEDDQGRLMCIICHNTDLGDGWEREGEDRRYFEKYSEPFAYPLGVNIVTYALTH